MVVSKVKFTILSTPNHYDRIIVGDSEGHIFTLGQTALKDLIDQKLYELPLSGGLIKAHRSMYYELVMRIRIDALQAITFWSEPLLGVGTICSYESHNKQWYLWTRGSFIPVMP